MGAPRRGIPEDTPLSTKRNTPSGWAGWRKLARDLDSIIGELQDLREKLKAGPNPPLDAALHQGLIDAALEVLVRARKSASLVGICERNVAGSPSGGEGIVSNR